MGMFHLDDSENIKVSTRSHCNIVSAISTKMLLETSETTLIDRPNLEFHTSELMTIEVRKSGGGRGIQ